MADIVATSTLGTLDYVAAVQADTLVVDGPLRDEVRLLLAVQFGKARLIDNDGPARDSFEEVYERLASLAPKLTIQGGTIEILLGIVARDLGLR